jgi:hypothetical protein
MTCKNFRSAAWLVALVALLAAAIFEKAAAIEVQCIEESKYKHLYQLFGGDARAFAAYFEINPDQHPLPDPEACRAVYLTGDPEKEDSNDRDKLLDVVIRNKGWLAAVYLSHQGGSVYYAQQIGYIVRTFYLKTTTIPWSGGYEPDFSIAPLPEKYSVTAAAKPANIVDEAKPKPPRCLLNEQVPVAAYAKGAISGIARPPDAFKPTFEENIDHPGGDYRQFDPSSADPRVCQKACLDDAKCRAWAYRKPEGATNSHPHCRLMERVLARVSDKLSVAGITRADTPDATYEEKTGRHGGEYRDFDLAANADPRVCQKACLDEARCRTWLYRKREGRRNNLPHCWLSERMPSVSVREDLHVSGTVLRLQYGDSTYEENTGRHGGEYRDFDLAANADPRVCQKACLDEARCRTWLYRKREGRRNNLPHCWLEEHAPSVLVPEDFNVSGTVIRADRFEPLYEKDVDRPGQAYRSFDLAVLDPQQCQKGCAEDAKCRAWAYEMPNAAFLASNAVNWQAYRERQRFIRSAPAPDPDACYSSCVQIQVAGIDRSGTIAVHRPRTNELRSMAEELELNANDVNMPQFYQYMDAGARVTQLMKETSTATFTGTHASRFPRYVLDYLIEHCETDPEQLQNLEKQLETTIDELAPATTNVAFKVDRLRAALGKLHERRSRVELCVAKEIEQYRLAAYDKLCGNSCDKKKLGAEFDAGLKKIIEQKP